MTSDRVKILDWFQRSSIPKGIFKFEDYYTQATVEVLGKNTFDAKQYVQANINRIWNYILEENRKNNKKGIIPIFSVVDFHAKTAIYPPYLPCTEKKARFVLRCLNTRPIILKKIDSLDPRQYEALGCLSSTISGADKYLLTPPGNEGGVDFFSRVRQPATNHIFSGSYAPLRIIGQSKKYSQKVTIGKVKEFKTAIDHVKLKYGKAKNLVPDWFSSMQGPVVGWMIAQSGFQSGALDYAKDEGIILSDTVDISEIITQSKKFYPNIDGAKRADVLEKEVNRIIKTSTGK